MDKANLRFTLKNCAEVILFSYNIFHSIVCIITVHNIIYGLLIAWTKEAIDTQLQWLKDGILDGGYGVEINKIVANKLQEYISVENKHVLVIGSKLPWLEVILLSLNVGNITTLEYNRYVTDHPKINVISPLKFGDLVRSNTAIMFDAMVTFSSLEHSGLGR